MGKAAAPPAADPIGGRVMEERHRRMLIRYRELTAEMASPEVLRDSRRMARVAREAGRMEAAVQLLQELERVELDLEEARALFELDGDADLRRLAEEEMARLMPRTLELAEAADRAILPDDDEEGGILVEVRSGTGGDEASLFAADLYRMYMRYAERQGWSSEVLSLQETDLGGVREVAIAVNGEGAKRHLHLESGVHRVQRVPVTETQGRIHTSAATVAVLPEPAEVDVVLNPEDLRIDTFRSGGAGGQHVNKTESGVRITHLPTGLVAICTDERSQHKNRDKAMRVLRARVHDAAERARESAVAAERRSQVGSGDRSERIRTYNFPQGRVTDHRIGLTVYHLPQVLDGDLSEFTDALLEAERKVNLERASETQGNG